MIKMDVFDFILYFGLIIWTGLNFWYECTHENESFMAFIFYGVAFSFSILITLIHIDA